jgi:uncharacterized damage-inducible protein DinB
MSTEAWLRGAVPGVPPVLQPAAHALVQAAEDVAAVAPTVPAGRLWVERGAATAGFHLIHLVGALDRLFTYARGEGLTDEQRATLRAEAEPHPEIDGLHLARRVTDAVERALNQLRATDAARVFDERRVGRAGLPSTVLGLLFHAAEHTTRHVGQFITTVKMVNP